MTARQPLKGVTWDHPRARNSLVAASAVFAHETGIQIDWHARSLQAFADEPIEKLARSSDLIILDHPHIGEIAASNCLLALSPVTDVERSSIGCSAESYLWEGQQWAYPIDASCQMAVRRPDVQDPFPRYWEDVLGSDASSYRLLTPLLPVDAFDMMLTLIASRGEDVLPLDVKVFCSEANGLLALTILKRLYKLGPAEAVAWNPIKVLEILATSDAFAASPCLFGYINYAQPEFRPHLLVYADLLTFDDVGRRRSILGGAGIGVSAFSAKKEAALRFATWIASEPVQSGVYLENEGQPAHRRTWESQNADRRFAGFFKGAFDTMSTAWTRPRQRWFLPFVDDVCEIFPAFFIEDRPEEAMLADINHLYRHHRQRRISA